MASLGVFCSLVTSTVWSSKKAAGVLLTCPHIYGHRGLRSQMWQTWQPMWVWDLALWESWGRVNSGETYVALLTQLPASRGFCGGQDGREEVKTSGMVIFFLHFAELVIHCEESDGTSRVRSMSLNNFSHLSFEQSTKVVKLLFGLAREQRSDWNKFHKRKSTHFQSLYWNDCLLKFQIFPERYKTSQRLLVQNELVLS